MPKSRDWAFPDNLQPKPEDVDFDLKSALDSVVLVRAEIPPDAFTASNLGTERVGNGVVIRDDGLVLTIGYVITEASEIWMTTNEGKAVAGHPLAYDQTTGFGLVQPLGRLEAPALARGTAAGTNVGDSVVVAGHGGLAHTLLASIVDKREFAGYWEYVLDEALFTTPAHPQWGGTAVIGADGRLIGIGSLLVQELVNGKSVQGNMIVPIDLLEPIFDDMVTLGRSNQPVRPWLGLYATESDSQVIISGVAGGGPADRAKLQAGDVLIEVAGQRVSGLADLFRKIWRLGAAGVDIPLTIARERTISRLSVQSADRQSFMKKPHLH
jgi:S1-C subfamily serine protease